MGGTRGRIYIKHPHLFKVRECQESGQPWPWSRRHWELSLAQRNLEYTLTQEPGQQGSSGPSALNLYLL